MRQSSNHSSLREGSLVNDYHHKLQAVHCLAIIQKASSPIEDLINIRVNSITINEES